MLVQVFRCLAGLWSIDTGSITKPGGGKALAGKVFYLPQKPYQVLGTLFDQISYPAAHDPAHLTEEMAGEILDEVELGEHATAWKRPFSLGGVFTGGVVCQDTWLSGPTSSRRRRTGRRISRWGRNRG